MALPDNFVTAGHWLLFHQGSLTATLLLLLLMPLPGVLRSGDRRRRLAAVANVV
jgi:uncharacterized membrane protein